MPPSTQRFAGLRARASCRITATFISLISVLIMSRREMSRNGKMIQAMPIAVGIIPPMMRRTGEILSILFMRL